MKNLIKMQNIRKFLTVLNKVMLNPILILFFSITQKMLFTLVKFFKTLFIKITIRIYLIISYIYSKNLISVILLSMFLFCACNLFVDLFTIPVAYAADPNDWKELVDSFLNSQPPSPSTEVEQPAQPALPPSNSPIQVSVGAEAGASSSNSQYVNDWLRQPSTKMLDINKNALHIYELCTYYIGGKQRTKDFLFPNSNDRINAVFDYLYDLGAELDSVKQKKKRDRKKH
jgi:hypothetical protein